MSEAPNIPEELHSGDIGPMNHKVPNPVPKKQKKKHLQRLL
jgi:hypothetical protein